MILLDAQQIKELRMSLGLSIPELARHCGVTDEAIRMWERGARRPRFESLKILNRLLEESQGGKQPVKSA
jgi:DNA-binding transcriptional regulator YiaG